MEVGVYIVVGTLVNRVVRAARKEEADLIVLGDRRRGMLQQFYAGSELAEIVRRAKIPVMVYRYAGERHEAIPTFVRPLLATDWGPASRHAVDYLRGLKPLIEEVHVVHAVSEKKLRGDSAMAIQQTRKDHRARLEEVCELFEADGIPAKAHLVIGDPVDMMAKVSRQCQASMIISGISTQQGWASRWRSGGSETIGDRSGLTTLLVPALAPE
jgi:nucleotide-binding universal stress UspA family protein